MIALRDSAGWETCLSGAGSSEAEILREMVRLVRERDPDVIEGHNLCNFDLPFLEARCKRHRVRLDLGRDGSRLRGRTSRFTAGVSTPPTTRATRSTAATWWTRCTSSSSTTWPTAISKATA